MCTFINDINNETLEGSDKDHALTSGRMEIWSKSLGIVKNNLILYFSYLFFIALKIA